MNWQTPSGLRGLAHFAEHRGSRPFYFNRAIQQDWRRLDATIDRPRHEVRRFKETQHSTGAARPLARKIHTNDVSSRWGYILVNHHDIARKISLELQRSIKNSIREQPMLVGC
ncbi:protein of unknown function [Agrobacterium pusense]|uniref:Uncharacterized protein n=1 Tax=Agrobacterium pusense TaxID=648995 RepID=U4PXR2_9HYPH|nr:protein of unknown function [Agrobacterium pusense]